MFIVIFKVLHPSRQLQVSVYHMESKVAGEQQHAETGKVCVLSRDATRCVWNM